EIIDAAANRAAMDSRRPDLGDAISERMLTFDVDERAAAPRRGSADRRSIDASHPPTVDRLLLLEYVEWSETSIVLDEGRSEQIDKELSPALEQAFKQMADAYRYVR